MAYSTIRYEIEDKVATLTFIREQANNGFNIPMCLEIIDVLATLEQNSEVQILVI